MGAGVCRRSGGRRRARRRAGGRRRGRSATGRRWASPPAASGRRGTIRGRRGGPGAGSTSRRGRGPRCGRRAVDGEREPVAGANAAASSSSPRARSSAVARPVARSWIAPWRRPAISSRRPSADQARWRTGAAAVRPQHLGGVGVLDGHGAVGRRPGDACAAARAPGRGDGRHVAAREHVVRRRCRRRSAGRRRRGRRCAAVRRPAREAHRSARPQAPAERCRSVGSSAASVRPEVAAT